MPVFAVTYEYDERAGARDAVRPDHRAFLRGLNDEGVLLASGPLSGAPGPGALLLLRADDEAARFAPSTRIRSGWQGSWPTAPCAAGTPSSARGPETGLPVLRPP